jgi:flagellar biosynthesis protein FlhA
VPVGVVLIIIMMVVPLPSLLIDMLIALNNHRRRSSSCLSAMFVGRPWSSPPSPLLLWSLTLFRLALNISATRLVLLDGFAGNCHRRVRPLRRSVARSSSAWSSS